MDSSDRSWPKTLGGIGLGLFAAGAVVWMRLAAGTAPPIADSRSSDSKKVVIERIIHLSEMPERPLAPESAKELERWMEDRPAQVMDYIDALADREQAAKLAQIFVKSVQGPHYDLLLNWLARLKDSPLAPVIFRGMMTRMIRVSPDQCIAMGFALGDSQEAKLARDEFFFALPLEQRVRLLKQQDPEERAWLLSRRATGFGERAPELCLEMIGELPKSEQTEQALGKLMKAWAGGANVYHMADPVSAVKGAMTIRDPEMRGGGLRVATSEWSKTDPDLAARWINKLSPGADRDAAIEGMVGGLAETDQKKALEWAASITDEGRRLETVERTARNTPAKKTDKP